jgi:glycosyltransferase involved in cell wall biosynthesis
VLLVSRKWPPAIGGMETYSVELADTLRGHFGVRRLVLPGRKDGQPPGLARYGLFLVRATLFCLLRGRAFKHVVFTDLIMFPAAVCHRLVAPRARRVVVVHGLDLVYQRRRGLLSRAYGAYFGLFRACQGAFSSIVANSRNTAALAEHAGLHRVTVINPSLPRSELTQATPTASDLPANWPAHVRRILYFGRLVPRKGALWYARSVLPSLPTDCVFVVAGQAPDPAYDVELRRCERTLCLGRVGARALAAMIRAADVVVMPNIATPDAVDVEGFGLAAVEAAALGGRLLASSIDGITDAVADGVTGTLVPPGDAATWIDATEAVLTDPTGGDSEVRDRIVAAAHALHSRDRQLASFLRILAD